MRCDTPHQNKSAKYATQHFHIWSIAMVLVTPITLHSALTPLSPHLVPVITSPGSSVSPRLSSPLPGRYTCVPRHRIWRWPWRMVVSIETALFSMGLLAALWHCILPHFASLLNKKKKRHKCASFPFYSTSFLWLMLTSQCTSCIYPWGFCHSFRKDLQPCLPQWSTDPEQVGHLWRDTESHVLSHLLHRCSKW